MLRVGGMVHMCMPVSGLDEGWAVCTFNFFELHKVRKN